jgi:hypothetical protein
MMDQKTAERYAGHLGKEGIPSDTFLQLIIDRILGAVPMCATERAVEFCNLLDATGISIRFDFTDGARFCALPPVGKVYLGADGLERSWAYCLYFAGAHTLYVADTKYAMTAPPKEDLIRQMDACLEWAFANDALRQRRVYPAELPKPVANPYSGTQFQILHFNSYINSLAWVTLHEVAHIVLGHGVEAPSDLETTRIQELEADAWAADWLMSKAGTEDARYNRMNGIIYGLAIAASLEMWTENEGPRDHPIYPERALAILDRFASQVSHEKARKGLWISCALLILQRASSAGKEGIFEGVSYEEAPRDFIIRARDAYH